MSAMQSESKVAPIVAPLPENEDNGVEDDDDGGKGGGGCGGNEGAEGGAHGIDLSLSVVNVKALMESLGPLNAVQLSRLLADEEAGKNRVTLVKYINGYITGKMQAAGGGENG
jgi:hypothetical protein